MNTESLSPHFDVIVIGGGHSGQSAALQLARARRRVLVMDAGKRRNRFSPTSYGLIGADGHASEAIAATGKAQLIAYPNVQWREDTAVHAERAAADFIVRDESGVQFSARSLMLAFGMVDEISDLEGAAERWGRSVYACPYCHGYELNQGRIGVIGNGPVSYPTALLMPDWGETVFLTNGTFEPDDEQRAALAQRGVEIEQQRIVRIVGKATVELADRRRIVLDGLFTVNRKAFSSQVAEQLGCAIEQGELRPYVKTDEYMQTSVPGVFACGDITTEGGSLPLVVGNGALAGITSHRNLIFPLSRGA